LGSGEHSASHICSGMSHDDVSARGMTNGQLELSAVPARVHDVIVVGGGPAGSTAAQLLSRQGHDVLLIERHRYPRDKACGDALMPDAMHSLERRGILERVVAQGRRVTSSIVYSPSRIRFVVDGDFLCVRRELFDAELALAAREAGATCVHARVRSVHQNGTGDVHVEVDGGATPLRARIVIVATGADVSLLRDQGMVAHEEPHGVAIRFYARSSFEIDGLLFSLDKVILPGYAWIFPVGPQLYNVGVGVFGRRRGAEPSDLRALLDRFLDRFPLARQLMAATTERTPIKGARLRCGLVGTRSTNGGLVVATGESIGATYPFSGEGIGKAMETAELAAEAVHQSLVDGSSAPLGDYELHLTSNLRPRYLGYEIAERWMGNRWLVDLIAWRARESPRVRRAVNGLVDETVDPRLIFSMRGLLTSIFG
jgi:geranylgeranyl reductase family protein